MWDYLVCCFDRLTLPKRARRTIAQVSDPSISFPQQIHQFRNWFLVLSFFFLDLTKQFNQEVTLYNEIRFLSLLADRQFCR